MCEICRKNDRQELVYCQACAVALHQECLRRSDSKHRVSRIRDGRYVLQCRYCMCVGAKGGNRSFITGKKGPLTEPFSAVDRDISKTKAQAENGGGEKDVVMTDKDSPETQPHAFEDQLFDPALLMFRCNNCLRAAMYEDLKDLEEGSEQDPSQCVDCNEYRDLSVHLILGWRMLPEDKLDTIEVARKELPDDFLREYLVKWVEQPYHASDWVSASWLHGVAYQKKRNFDAKKYVAIEKETDIIPEDYNKIDVVLDVTYTDDKDFEKMRFENEEEAFDAIGDVALVLAKWQQVQYDDISWSEPPIKSEDSSELLRERWDAFEFAYRDWVRSFYVMVEKRHATKAVKISDAPFSMLEKKSQPNELVGGKLMPYQMEGLNWLYYQYYLKHPAILADEMGLGKTIQIVSLLSVLLTDWAIAPFLIVAPNSTISNWKRECQKWAPHMRVAAFYGEKSAKSVIQEYELIHNDTNGQPLKVHAVITSYNTIEADAALLRRYHWACLIVDEGQRLKNDQSILFKLLSEFRVNHRILLTGTPLQNNTKELFNLLQFLDPKKMNAEKLEAHFNIEQQESLTELHSMLQPYFLRRTKAQVLKFLPSKNEVIVPVTMSALQRELYKTILSKNAELMRLVMARTSAGKTIQNYNNSSMANVLQQIRKILSHPFIYSPDIEESIEDEAQSLINLTNACAKLQLLRVLLPQLRAKGHRVLIFCQFIMMLDILEDWTKASGISSCRIDGNTPTPERQEAIDLFNKPGSEITCFLLSTRAGGVGINLATADTVIIYDADFNPHQDLQAVARAHRIGQKNKVVVFTLVTRNTAEEKILQIGRRKMVLDQLIIENMATKDENVPFQEILSFGAAALFDEEAKNELVYDISTVNNLIESSYADIAMPNADEETNGEKTSKDSFGFAKVWAGDTLVDDTLGESEAAQKEATQDLWGKILAERAAEAKAEADRKSAEFSKGRRRTVKDYNEAHSGKPFEDNKDGNDKAVTIESPSARVDSDIVDFSEARITDDSSDASSDATISEPITLLRELGGTEAVSKNLPPTFQSPAFAEAPADHANTAKRCSICSKIHLGGQCQIRNIPIEVCTLCRTAHFSAGRAPADRLCPVFTNLADMQAILNDLKMSEEPPVLIDQAKAYIRSVMGAVRRQNASSSSTARDQPDRLPQNVTTHNGQAPSATA